MNKYYIFRSKVSQRECYHHKVKVYAKDVGITKFKDFLGNNISL
ncbi:hypothetical protein [Romboutsia ilealis]|nr:hypothetical protein [Romboutsia ilealis]